MRRLALVVGLLALASAAHAEPMEVCWQNPTENVDSTPLTDLTTVRLYWGTASRAYTDQRDMPTDVPGASICATIEVPPGTYYVGGTAIDADGNESAYSNEITRTVDPSDPAPPVLPIDPVCADCQIVSNTSLLITETGATVTLAWQDAGAERYEIEVLEFPVAAGAVPVVRGNMAGTSYDWRPGRAGLYYSRVRACTGAECGDWSESHTQGWLYFIRLAAPTGGGID